MAVTWPDAGNSNFFPTFTNEVKTKDGAGFGNAFGEFPSSTAFGDAFPPVASHGWDTAWSSGPNSTAPADFGASSAQGWGFDSFDQQRGFESAAKSQSSASVPGRTGSNSMMDEKTTSFEDRDSITGHNEVNRVVSRDKTFLEAAFDIPKRGQKEKQGGASRGETNGSEATYKQSSKERIEMQRRIAVQDRVPALKRYAADLSEELSSLRAYAGRQAVAAEQCIEALHSRSQELAAELIKMQTAGPVSAEAIRQRQAVIREEARVLERRMEADKFGGTNGPSWAQAETEKREALEARIAGAKEREAAALEAALAEMKQSEQKIAMLRVEKRELESRVNSEISPSMKSRYEAFIAAQKALADRAAALSADPGASRLDQALSAASAAAGAATGNHAMGSRKPPEYLVQATKMLCGLAEAERRRGGLLVEKWRELHGNAPFNNSGNPDPVVFSPSPAYAWDLDVCRNAS